MIDEDSLDVAQQVGARIYPMPVEALFWTILWASWALRDRCGLDQEAITTECNQRADALKAYQQGTRQ